MSDFKAGSMSQVLDDLIKKHGIVEVITTVECLCGDIEAILRSGGEKTEARKWRTLASKLYDAAHYGQDKELY